MRSILCVTGPSGERPDFGFLARHGFAVTHLADTSPDLGRGLAEHDIVILACETRVTQHARIWNCERELFQHVRGGGRLLFCAPGIGAWSMVWSAYPALLPVTPFKRSAFSESFAERFRWDRGLEEGRRSRVVPSVHPVCDGIRDWPGFYEGPKPGSYNAYDFDRWLPKPHSEVALRTEDGGVALAFMEFGKGRTAFVLADVHDDGGLAWSGWSDRERFWGSLLQYLDSGDLRIERAPDGVVPFAPRVPLIPRSPFKFRASPRTGNAEWPRILTRTDWTMMSDNQVTVNVSGNPITRDPGLFGDGWHNDPLAELGIGHAKFYPPPTQFESALSADVLVGGEVVGMLPVPGSYRWQPHLAVNQFESADGSILIEKRMAVADDTVCVELRVMRGTIGCLRLRGFNRFHGFLEVSGNKLLGQVESGVMFGVSASVPVRWTTRENPLRYEAEARCDGVLAIAFTAAIELDPVKARLDAAMDNPGHVFATAFNKWDAYFLEQVPAFHSDDPDIERLVYGAFLGFGINLYDIPFEPWRDPHSCPSKMHFDPQWEQDDVQSATIGKWLRDPALIERQLLRPFRIGYELNANAAYGLVERKTQGTIGELQQYSIPLREVFLFDPRPELRGDIIAAMLREENESLACIPVDPGTGLACIFNCLGMDDSPRWDIVSPGQKAEWFQTFERAMLTPDVNATMAHRAAFLSELFEESGDMRAAGCIERSRRLKALVRRHLWSGTVGFFVDRVAGGSEPSDVLTPMGFLPLLLGPFDDEVTKSITRPIYDPTVFQTPFGLPTVACSHPKFDPMSYWRGSIWPRTNWFAAESLYHGGLKQAAAEVTRRWIELIVKNGADMRENFNPITGEKKCVTMFTEGLAGAADVYFKNVVGFRPTWAGFDLDPIALDRNTPSFSFGPFRYREQEITISWDRANGMGEIRLNDHTEKWTPGIFRSFQLPHIA